MTSKLCTSNVREAYFQVGFSLAVSNNTTNNYIAILKEINFENCKSNYLANITKANRCIGLHKIPYPGGSVSVIDISQAVSYTHLTLPTICSV